MANIKKLKANGQDIVPITHEQAVLDSNGVTLESKLATINNTLSRLENNSTPSIPSTPDTPSTPSLEGNIKILTIGNYTIKYNETDDTLDFIYNGVIDVPEEPTVEEISLVWEAGNLNSSGAEESNDYTIRSNFVTIEANYTYSFYLESALSDPTGIRVYFYDTNKTFISRTDGDALGYTTGVDIPIDIPSNTVYLRFKSNKNTSTTLNNINALFTLRKTKVNSYVREGLSMYIDANDVASYGSVRDITGKQNITNHGVSTTLDNGCLNFVSTESDYIDTGLVPNLTTWSAELYFYFTETPTSSQTILGWGVSGNKMRIAYSGSNGVLGVQSNNNYFYTIDGASDLTSPHHLIITMNNGAMTSYLDGVKTVLCASGDVQTSHTGTLKIGTKYDAIEEFINMNLRMFRFYDGKVLTDEEALQNYNYETKVNSYVREGLSMYIDASDVASYGSIRDITGNQTVTNHGVSTTLNNGCLNFVASESDYIDTGFVPNLTTWSTEIYAYYTSIPTDTSNLYCWGSSSTNRIRVGYGGSDACMTILVNSTKQQIGDVFLTLQHLVVTANNGTYTVYINGVQQYTFSGGVLSSNTNNMVIGTSSYSTDCFANMNLKIFRHYDGKVLSAEEVLQNYNYEINRNSKPGTGEPTQEEIIPLTWAVGNLSGSNGSETEQANSLRSSFAAIVSGSTYSFYLDTSFYDPSGVRVYFYDTNKTYISRTDGNVIGYESGIDISIDVPTNAAYMRFKANASGTTVVDTIGSLFTLKRKY